MKKLIILSTVILLVLSMVTGVLGCQEAPTPAPAPAPAPPSSPAPAPPPIPAPTSALPSISALPPTPLPPAVDEPEYSKEDMLALIWNKIPTQLPGGHSKNELVRDTRTATYEGDGKWTFSASGQVEQQGPLTIEIVRTEAYWVERESREVTTYELQLRAIYYEKSRTLDIENEKKIDEKVITETSDTPILRQEIKLKWMNTWGGGHNYSLEGSIENIGKIPITNLLIEFFFYDEDGNLLNTKKLEITPDLISPGEKGTFRNDFVITGKSYFSYTSRFVLETGEVFEYLEGSGEEEPVYFYEMDIEKAIADNVKTTQN